MTIARIRIGAGLRAGLVIWTLVLAAAGAQAQGLSGLTGGDDGPLRIEADEGIEWRRNEQVYIARGNAVARRESVTVHGERLIAHYRDRAGGDDTEIHRIEAIGDVRIVGDNETAYGDRGVYDVDKAVVVLTGDDLRLVTGEETITAEDSLEYWEARNLAVARGNAVAVRGDRRVRADVLTAHFQGDSDDGAADARAVSRIEAFDNVQIASPQSFARGDKAVYDTRSRVATLIGNVKISRGENQLNGGWAEVNLETGVSRLRGAPPDSGRAARVQGLLAPGSGDDLQAPGTAGGEEAQ